MAHNRTRVYQYSAEFRHPRPTGGPLAWQITRWEGYETFPYAVSTLARDMAAPERDPSRPARALSAADVARLWPHGAEGVAHLRVSRAFVIPDAPGSRFGAIVALVDINGLPSHLR